MMRQVDARKVVDPHQALVGLEVSRLVEAGDHADAGVVHEAVDPSVGGGRALDQEPALIEVGDIRGHRDRLGAEGLALRGNLGEAARITGGQCEPRLLARESQGQRMADALRGARQYHDLASEGGHQRSVFGSRGNSGARQVSCPPTTVSSTFVLSRRSGGGSRRFSVRTTKSASFSTSMVPLFFSSKAA